MKIERCLFGLCTLVCTVSFLGIVSGCGGAAGPGAEEPESRPIDEDLLSLVPEGAQGVLWMDLAGFRSSQFYVVLEELLGKDFALFDEAGSLDPLRQGDEVLVALQSPDSGAGSGSEGEFLALLKGRMTRDEVLGAFADVEGAVSEELGPFASIRTPEMVVVLLTDRTIAIGSRGIMAQVIPLAQRQGVSLRTREGFEDFALGEGDVAKVLYKRGSVLPHLEQYGAGQPPIDFDSVVSGNALLKLDKGLFLQLVINTETQMNASSMAGDLKAFKDQAQENMLILFLGVDWLLDRISIQSEKTSLTVALNLDFTDLQSLMQLASRLRKIRELADRGDGGSGMPFDLPSNQAGEGREGGGE